MNTAENSNTSEVSTQEETATSVSPEQSNPETGSSNVNEQAAQTITLTMGQDDHEDYLKWKAESRERHITKRIKELGSQKVVARRTTLVVRRSDCKAIAPDADVVAYSDIYAIKNPTTDPKLKITITDNEIMAYLVLSPEFKTTPTLEEITAKVKEMTDAGELPGESNDAGEAEEAETEQ